jgi:hypothetical protein
MFVRESRVARQMRQTGLMPLAVILLGGIAIRNPHRRLTPRHHFVHDPRGARIIGLMHDRAPAMENPMIRVRPLDPDAGFVAGHDLCRPKDRLRLLGLLFEPGMRADEHVHQRALAHAEPESIVEQAAQPLIGQRLEALEINRQRVDAWTERRRRRDRGRRRLRLKAAMRALAGDATVADDMGFDRRERLRRTARRRLACGRKIRPDHRPADGCAARARASPRRAGSSRAFPSCPSTAAWRTCANSCQAAGAGAPVRSVAPCSDAANHRDPSRHGFRHRSPWQGGG